MMKSTLISIFIHNLGYSIHTMYAPVNTGGIARAGLTIGQTGKCPRPCVCILKHSFTGFSCF